MKKVRAGEKGSGPRTPALLLKSLWTMAVSWIRTWGREGRKTPRMAWHSDPYEPPRWRPGVSWASGLPRPHTRPLAQRPASCGHRRMLGLQAKRRRLCDLPTGGEGAEKHPRGRRGDGTEESSAAGEGMWPRISRAGGRAGGRVSVTPRNSAKEKKRRFGALIFLAVSLGDCATPWLYMGGGGCVVWGLRWE